MKCAFYRHLTKIISAQSPRKQLASSFPSPVQVRFPCLLHIFVYLSCWFPSISPPLPEFRVLPFQQTRRPHCSCFGWLVLNVSRHQMTSQHCIDSNTLRSASLPRPRTHMMRPYPWPWWWRNVGSGSRMAQQLAGTCNPHLNTKCFNLYKQLRPVSPVSAVRLLSITGLYRTRTSGNNTSTFLTKLNNTVPVVLFNNGSWLPWLH